MGRVKRWWSDFNKMAFGDKLNIAISIVANVAIFLVSLCAIGISLEAYFDAHASGVEQSKALTKQVDTLTGLTKTAEREREALDKSVNLAGDTLKTLSAARTEQAALLQRANDSLREVARNAAREQQLANENLGISREQVGLVTKERDVLTQTLKVSRSERNIENERIAKERERQTNMPLVHLSLSNSLGSATGGKTPLQIDLTSGSQKVSLSMTNTGKSNLHNTIILISAFPNNVSVIPISGLGSAPNAIQVSFNNPIYNAGNVYITDFMVKPGDVTELFLTIQILGENDGGVSFHPRSTIFHVIARH